MKRKIFRSIFFASVAVLILGLGIATGFLYYYFTDVQSRQLETELMLAAAGVENSGTAYLESVDASQLRYTLVDKDGNVVFDTDADTATMDNHADRQEIRDAFDSGDGHSVRYSTTLTEKTIYRSQLLCDGSVLRISVSESTVLALIGGIAPWLFLVAVLTALLSWFLATRLTKRIITPLCELDMEHPLENDSYEELQPLLLRIHGQHQQIDEQLHTLRQKTGEFELITSNMKEGLVLLDAKAQVLSINPAAADIFGVDRNFTGGGFISGGEKLALSEAFSEAMEQGFAHLRYEKNGHIYRLYLSRIENGGQAVGVALLAYDISQQEQAERSRREFSANVSHELKTPLTAIIAGAELIENGMAKKDDASRFATHIRREAARLLSLIEDIIRLSHLEEGQELPLENVDLNMIVLEAVEQLKDMADKNSVSLSYEGEKLRANTMASLVYEICYNLVDNAIKYNTPGGSAHVTLEREADMAVLTVKDSGIGIDAQHLERVFERFYRVDKSHSRLIGGTGLGLSIVKHAANRLDAHLAIESEIGKGTEVKVSFPLK